ncbi:MAG TPA: hypothetical protein VGP05_00205 [Pseudonocardia sp.]|nr:hypothetical protein [Pseudonocardia sp.]
MSTGVGMRNWATRLIGAVAAAGSNDVSDIFLPNTGHALTLERTAPQMREQVSDWLDRHGL